MAPRLSKRSETGCEIWYVIEYKRCPVSGATGGRCGGAGGGTRTHKGLRPEMYQISAFTGFATPAPHRLRTTAIHKAETRDLMHATVPRVHYGVRMSTSDNLVLAGGVGFLRTVLARSYEGM